jgi:23S rRNA (cytosine1962-C5)-methyltransferase
VGTPIDRRRIAVRVTPDALRQVKAGHPWLFDHSITSLSHDGASGDLAVIFDAERKFTAVGLFDPDSPIRIKVLHHGRPVTVDADFWWQRLTAAAERRASLSAAGDTTGYRLVHGENDQMPGLVVDVYDRSVVVKLYSAAWFAHLPIIVTQLTRLLHPERVVLRLARNVQHSEWADGDTLAGIAPDGPVLFLERGLTFEADIVSGQKTGHFLDQRDNRRLVGAMCADAQVLDVFASTGGFTVHAAAGGARDVTAIDLSAPTLAVARRNLDHNRLLPSGYRPIVGDAFEELERLRGRQYDVVVVDPPSFAQRQHERDRALRAYARLTELAIPLVRAGGVLVQCSCSSRVAADDFFRTVALAASHTGRPLDEIRRTAHPIDHPVGFPEGAYLKAVFSRVGARGTTR